MGMEPDFMDGPKVFPPGFRFHPTDEELVGYYLKRKICCKRHHTDVIGETDVYKCDPEDLPGMSMLKSADRQWFFFTPRDRKYPNGSRANRTTIHGYWKATGKDRIISYGSRAVGIKKTLVFYRGRAPSGLRTDWVMHEYTMDEQELKRCQNVKEYYALCKVFKKSGPGPKNGEQYGAPFREEDWDNDDIKFPSFAFEDSPITKRADDTVPVNEFPAVNDPCLTSLDDLNEFMNELASDPIMNLPTFHNDEETESNFVDYTSRDVHIPANLHPYYAPEVSSVPVLNVVDTGVTEEDIFGDFLEINDLLGPCNPVGELQIDELDGLNEFDFEDASIFFDDGISESLQIPESRDFSYYFDCDVDGMSIVSNPTDQLQQQSTTVNGILYQEEQTCSITNTEAGPNFVSWSNPGFIHEIQTLDLVNHCTGANENGINQQEQINDQESSWFSSSIWSFVESIPTTPASASESDFVNRTFERVSSFRRLRLNTRNLNASVSSSNNNALSSSAKFRTTAFMFLSFVGILCAVILML